MQILALSRSVEVDRNGNFYKGIVSEKEFIIIRSWMKW